MKKITVFLCSFDWIAAGFAGIWLVFLFFPATFLLNSSQHGIHGIADKAAGIALLVGFAVIYLFSYGANELIPAARSWQRALGWSLLLAIPVLLLIPLIGPWVLYLGTYFVALWCFQVTYPAGISVGLGIASLIIVVMLWKYFDIFQYSIIGFFSATLFIVVAAFFSSIDERREKIKFQLAQAQHSEKIARDVHDILGHTLTVINLKAELAATLIDTAPRRAQQEIKQVVHLFRTALAEVRATVTRIKSPDLAGELQAARQGLETAKITAHLPGEIPAVSASNAALFSWVLRESITNVIRHSRAANCWARISADRIEIIDDGGSQQIVLGNGLTGLQQRVQEAGGDLIIETGACTRVLATMNGDTSPLTEQRP